MTVHHINRTIVIEADSRYLTQRVVAVLGQFDEALEALGGIEQARDDAQSAAIAAEAAQIAAEEAAAEAAELGTPSYASLTVAQAATVPAPANLIMTPGAVFERSATDVALTTADGATWRPSGALTPYHFGAVPWDMSVDQSAKFNALADWLRARYDTGAGAFKAHIDLCGQTWRCDSWNLTNIRQPAFAFGNGTIVSFGTNRIAVDCAGTNHGRILGELSIEAPNRAQSPRVGMCIGRAASGGSAAPISPDWAGRVRIDGYFTQASFVNLASEVSRMQLHLTNRARSLGAVCLAHVGHMGTFDHYLGGLTSEYVTLPTAADGAMSNILHDYGQLICKRNPDFAIPLLNITRTNPAVATFDPAALTAASISPGDAVYFHDHAGMPEIKHRRLIALAVNNVAGSVTLGEVGGGNVNSTGYTAFGGGGRMWNSTGPAALFGSIRGLRMSAAYMLTYGDRAVILDCTRGTNSDLVFDFQAEASPVTSLEFYTGSTACIVQGCKINLPAANQAAVSSFVRATTGGTLRIDNLDMTVHGYSGTPSGGVFGGSGVVTLNNAVLRYPVAAHAQWTGWASFSGAIQTNDTGVMRRYPAMASATAAQLQSLTSTINNDGKTTGLPAYDTTNSRVVYASGGAVGATWRDGDGAVVYTPT